MAFRSLNRDSQFYSLILMGKNIHVELHPNKTSGGSFRIRSIAEGEALIGRIQEGIDALADAERIEKNKLGEGESGDDSTG